MPNKASLVFLALLTLSFAAGSQERLIIEPLHDGGAILIKADLVKVEKSQRKMFLYVGEQLLKTYHVALGGNPIGHKQKEGDSRTPEGAYVLDYIKEDSAYYRSMHISYPNKNDIKNAKKRGDKPGGFIMIHGQKNGFGHLAAATQKFDWTDGCIALTNEEMDEFLSVVPVGTKISISP